MTSVVALTELLTIGSPRTVAKDTETLAKQVAETWSWNKTLC